MSSYHIRCFSKFFPYKISFDHFDISAYLCVSQGRRLYAVLTDSCNSSRKAFCISAPLVWGLGQTLCQRDRASVNLVLFFSFFNLNLIFLPFPCSFPWSEKVTWSWQSSTDWGHIVSSTGREIKKRGIDLRLLEMQSTSSSSSTWGSLGTTLLNNVSKVTQLVSY